MSKNMEKYIGNFDWYFILWCTFLLSNFFFFFWLKRERNFFPGWGILLSQNFWVFLVFLNRLNAVSASVSQTMFLSVSIFNSLSDIAEVRSINHLSFICCNFLFFNKCYFRINRWVFIWKREPMVLQNLSYHLSC